MLRWVSLCLRHRHPCRKAQRHTGRAILEWVVIFLVPIQYLIERVQDFVLAALIGLIASLVSPSRQVAATIALCVMLALLIVRGIFITSPIGTLPPPQALSRILVLMIAQASQRPRHDHARRRDHHRIAATPHHQRGHHPPSCSAGFDRASGRRLPYVNS